MPSVSLLLCVHNGAAYLPACLNSIFTQSFPDFELIIIDDCSTDDSPAILEALTDPRVKIFRNPENVGLTKSLNRGLTLTTGQYIARIDADDTMHPTRLQQQVNFLENNPDYGIVGSFAQQMDANGTSTSIQKMPVTNAEIQWFSLLSSPFLHPTVMLRKTMLDAHSLTYDTTFRTTQDYDLWARMLRVTKGYNIPLPLTHLRVHEGAISHTKKAAQFANHQTIACRTIKARCGIDLPPAVITTLLEAFHQPRNSLSWQELGGAIRQYLRLYRAFRKNTALGVPVLKTVLLRIARAVLRR
jgi:glycosyltransferase involved in cell wall biosynthesis